MAGAGLGGGRSLKRAGAPFNARRGAVGPSPGSPGHPRSSVRRLDEASAGHVVSLSVAVQRPVGKRPRPATAR